MIRFKNLSPSPVQNRPPAVEMKDAQAVDPTKEQEKPSAQQVWDAVLARLCPSTVEMKASSSINPTKEHEKPAAQRVWDTVLARL